MGMAEPLCDFNVIELFGPGADDSTKPAMSVVSRVLDQTGGATVFQSTVTTRWWSDLYDEVYLSLRDESE